MQVLHAGECCAPCRGPQGIRTIDLRLVGPQEAGNWVLVFLDAAREVIDAARAARIQDALGALNQALAGNGDVDRWFPDLANREPQLPDFLKPLS
jgi:hydrogenase expression/formation protein HypC